MLAIRLQRLGRKGYPVYRLAVQEAHTKEAKIEKELAEKYLYNGAQPTPRVVKLLEEAGIEMPKWVKKPAQKTRAIKNAEKLRRNQPKEEVTEEA